jgi:uncharacterized damage-inducible protein DinB
MDCGRPRIREAGLRTMAATYPFHVIDAAEIPRADDPAHQHLVDVYASEVNKTASVWRAFDDVTLSYRPHPRSTTVAEVFRHELLSGRRFFGEFLGLPEPEAASVAPNPITVESAVARLADSVRARLPHLARGSRAWWDESVKFFDVDRSRLWVFWRRVLHSAHHRTQLTVYLRLLDRPVPPIYGPTADVTWSGADPTRTVEAAQRK